MSGLVSLFNNKSPAEESDFSAGELLADYAEIPAAAKTASLYKSLTAAFIAAYVIALVAIFFGAYPAALR